MKKILTTLMMIFLLLGGMGGISHAWTVDLAWDASPTPGITRYVIYWGWDSRNYRYADASNIVGDPVLTTKTITGLSSGTYYVTVFAYDSLAIPSEFSNEICISDSPLDKIQNSANIYSTIQTAYDNANTGNIIQVIEQNFAENLVLDDNVNITLGGSYTCNNNFDTQVADSYTVINGNVTITDGSITIDSGGNFGLF
jgi:hypothetical protein